MTEGLHARGKRQYVISGEHQERQPFLGSFCSKKQLSREFSLDPFLIANHHTRVKNGLCSNWDPPALFTHYFGFLFVAETRYLEGNQETGTPVVVVVLKIVRCLKA